MAKPRLVQLSLGVHHGLGVLTLGHRDVPGAGSVLLHLGTNRLVMQLWALLVVGRRMLASGLPPCSPTPPACRRMHVHSDTLQH